MLFVSSVEVIVMFQMHYNAKRISKLSERRVCGSFSMKRTVFLRSMQISRACPEASASEEDRCMSGSGSEKRERTRTPTSSATRAACTTRFASRFSLKMKPKTRGARTKNMDKLIEAVQARECLWDKSYRGHRNRFKLERYWNEVAAEVGTSSVNCRKKWKNLKDQCRKEMKKHPTDSDWPHFTKLKFIHHQFLAEEEDGDQDTADEVCSINWDTLKTPKLGYTMRKKLLMNKRRNIDVDMIKLIDLVRGKELIWNRQLKGHHNWYKLDECWKEIAQELGVTRDEARLKWKYLRDQARKEVRKSESEWELMPRLQFLTNQFNDFEANDSIQDDSYAVHDYEPETSNSYYNLDLAQTSTPTIPQPTETPNKEEEFDEFDSKPVIMETDFYDDDDDAQKSVNNETGEPKDEDIGFFDSLLPHVKKLGPAKKLMLRMKIQELVYNTVYNTT